MEPVFHLAKKSVKRVIYAEGEEERVLRAAQVVVDETLARPVLVGPAGRDQGAHRAAMGCG